jgi:hypothetical protein
VSLCPSSSRSAIGSSSRTGGAVGEARGGRGLDWLGFALPDAFHQSHAPRLPRAPFLYARQKHAVFLSMTSQLSTIATAVPAPPKMDLQQAAA